MRWIAAAMIAAPLLAGGCATVPEKDLTQAEASILSAQRLGAGEEARAAILLERAQEEVDSARRYYESGQERRARGMLLRAQADAELAIALSQQAPLRKQAED